MILAVLFACASDDLPPGPSFRLSGPVDAAVSVDAPVMQGWLAWVWRVDGQLCGRGERVAFEPQVWRYALLVSGPPEIDTPDVCVPAPPSLADGPLVAWGVPVLSASEVETTLQLDPGGVVDWLAGAAPFAGAIGANDGAIAAMTPSHLLAVAADNVAWAPEACRFDQISTGLTVYADAGVDCGGWERLAEPGSRTEFQGVALSVPPGG
jgi:hypothetical protein